jgi:hypothetical protein
MFHAGIFTSLDTSNIEIMFVKHVATAKTAYLLISFVFHTIPMRTIILLKPHNPHQWFISYKLHIYVLLAPIGTMVIMTSSVSVT